MKKRLLALTMTAVMMFSIVGCRGGEASPAPASEAPKSEAPASEAPKSEAPAAPAESDYKIGIITGTVSQGEEEFRAAEALKKEFGDKVVTTTYPDNFTNETETTISNVLSLVNDPKVKAIVFVQAVPGAAAAIDKAREINPDILFIAGVPGEDPAIIASKADICLQPDELGMGSTMVEQAKKLGAKNFVHYSFPRHMSYALLAARRDLLKENCAKEGINFIEATAPDPTGDSGVAGAQQFILEDIPRKVKEYGTETVFFSTNCSMQEPLIKMVAQEKALLVQQCCPSPFHGYPGALGIEIPEDKQGNVDFINEQISAKLASMGQTGRMGTWPVPINMMFIRVAYEYACLFAEGKTDGRADDKVLRECIDKVAGEGKTKVTTYDEGGVQLKNFYMVLCDYILY